MTVVYDYNMSFATITVANNWLQMTIFLLVSMYHHKIGKERLSLWPTLESLGVCFGSKRMKNLRHSWRQSANLSSLFGKVLYVWDNNHRVQAWLPCINSIHPNDVDWHVSVHSFVLDTTCELVELLTAMTNLNKYVKIKPKHDAWFVSNYLFLVQGLLVLPFVGLSSLTMLSHPLCTISFVFGP